MTQTTSPDRSPDLVFKPVFMARYYAEGKKAYRFEQPLESCPYLTVNRIASWYAGWTDAWRLE